MAANVSAVCDDAAALVDVAGEEIVSTVDVLGDATAALLPDPVAVFELDDGSDGEVVVVVEPTVVVESVVAEFAVVLGELVAPVVTLECEVPLVVVAPAALAVVVDPVLPPLADRVLFGDSWLVVDEPVDGPAFLPSDPPPGVEMPVVRAVSEEPLPSGDVEEGAEPASSAWAKPDPLTRAALRPSATAPAPNHLYGSRRCLFFW